MHGVPLYVLSAVNLPTINIRIHSMEEWLAPLCAVDCCVGHAFLDLFAGLMSSNRRPHRRRQDTSSMVAESFSFYLGLLSYCVFIAYFTVEMCRHQSG